MSFEQRPKSSFKPASAVAPFQYRRDTFYREPWHHFMLHESFGTIFLDFRVLSAFRRREYTDEIASTPLMCSIRDRLGEADAIALFTKRKVRAPQSRMVDNVDRPQGQGKCNRKQTAEATR